MTTLDLSPQQRRAIRVAVQRDRLAREAQRAMAAPRVAGDELFPDDEPPRLPLPVPTSRITCRWCDAKATVPIDRAALLCNTCMADLVITRNSIEAVAEQLDTRYRDAADAFEALKEACTDESTLARWDRAEAAGVTPPLAFKASWAARETEPTELARLLRAWAAFDAECAQIATHRDKVTAALAEIAQAELAERAL